MGEQRAAYAFVSYCSANRGQANAMREILRRREINHWMAPYDIPAGTNYACEIERAIKDCSCFLLLLTKEAQESGHVAREVERAIYHKKTIVPICLDDAPLNEAYSYYLGTCQMVFVADITEETPAIQMVVERLESLIDADVFGQLPVPFVEMLGKWLDLPKSFVIDPERAALLEKVYDEMSALLTEEGYDCRVVVEPCPLGTGAASLSFTVFSLEIRQIKAFCDVVSQLDNFEIYPIREDRVCFAGVMHGIARALPMVEGG